MILSSVVLNLPMSLSKAFFSSLLCFWFTVYPLDRFLQFPPPLSWNLPSVLVCYPPFHKILKHINHSYFKYSLWQSQHLSHLWSLFLLISSPVNLLLLVVVLVMVVMVFLFWFCFFFFGLKNFDLILNIICRATEKEKGMLILLLMWRNESIQSNRAGFGFRCCHDYLQCSTFFKLPLIFPFWGWWLHWW